MTGLAPDRLKAPSADFSRFAPAQSGPLVPGSALSAEQDRNGIREVLSPLYSSSMEPRAGHDFGRIPIHPAPRATGIIQRKIAARAPIDSYLASKGVSGYSKSGGVYSAAKRSAAALDKEIVCDLLSSQREFPIVGSTAMASQTSLDSHVKARKGVVKTAFDLKNKIAWGVGSSMRMNPQYWQRSSSGWEARQGVDTIAATTDVLSNPSRFPYAMACHAAAGVAMVAGSGSASYEEFGSGVRSSDWVPGEWGYVKNAAFRSGVSGEGHEGQNLIYTGFNQFWGHPGGVKTMAEWTSHVRGFDGGKGRPEIADWRRIPSSGIG